MRVDVVGVRNTLRWSFHLDDEDGVYTDKISMVKTKFTNELQIGTTIDDVHPDHLALIALLVAHPFVDQTLHIPWTVSERFAEACQKISRYRVIFEGTTYSAYLPRGETRPGLAFSGGADSTAALLVMPEHTLSVFMDRPMNFLKQKISLYNKSAAMATVEFARSCGHEVLMLPCDVEYIRQPLGFPTDLIPSIPLIAGAKHHNVDAVAFGTVLESAYRVGHENARDYASSHHFRFWGRLFRAAGLPLYLPVSGVSEVGTSFMVLNSEFHPYTRSCIRGEWPHACENCWKCFRKNMLELKMAHGAVDEDYVKQGLKIPEVQRKMSAYPVSHENVLAWAMKGSKGEVCSMLNARLEGASRSLDYLECHYPPALDLMPEQYRSITKQRLEQHLSPMSEKDWPTVTKHSMTEWLESRQAIEAKASFDAYIKNEC